MQRKREKKKKSFMLSARSLSIAWGDDKRYWDWINMPDSRLASISFLFFSVLIIVLRVMLTIVPVKRLLH